MQQIANLHEQANPFLLHTSKNQAAFAACCCLFQALPLDCRGVLAMEGLNLDAGRLGPVLLFNLSSQGVGYTSAVKVRVTSSLAQSKIGTTKTKGISCQRSSWQLKHVQAITHLSNVPSRSGFWAAGSSLSRTVPGLGTAAAFCNCYRLAVAHHTSGKLALTQQAASWSLSNHIVS